MPGLAPFLEGLRLPPRYCTNCGFWQRHFAVPPSCPLCLDARHVLPPEGWRFLNLDEAQAAYPMHWRELEPDVWVYWNDPVDGIGARCYLARTAAGNFMFEGAAVFTDEALEHIASLGGIDVLSASHPHSYGALFQLQDRFEPELALHAGDLAWWGAFCVTWPFDARVEVLPGVELRHTGGHFEGHAVAWLAERGILCCGDALKFELDPADDRRARSISSHKAFVRGIPCSPDECRRYREVFADMAFEQTWTPFEAASNSGRAEALALLDAMLATRPHPHAVPLDELSGANGTRTPPIEREPERARGAST